MGFGWLELYGIGIVRGFDQGMILGSKKRLV